MDYKLELVIVPVSDVDRAKQFYAEKLGFEVDVDHTVNDEYRIVQLTPPGSACSINIGKGMSDSKPGSLRGTHLVVADVEAARAELAERGVDISPVQHFEDGEWLDGKGGPWNSFARFEDPDGNSWELQERPSS
jgi:catechol 2,3-dioxygenase-like lactoylglutathione lyase family enzyme